MEIYAEQQKLVENLRERIYPWRKYTIGIDGVDGSGKSTLARYLAWELEMPVIETDLLIVSDGEPPLYDYKVLLKLISARHRLERPVIIEGVFLLDTFSKINIQCDYLVYVECSDTEGSQKLMRKLNNYREQYDPKSKANFNFKIEL